MTDYQEVLLGLVSKQLFSTDYTPPENTDWEKVFEEAKVQSVGLIVFEAASKYINSKIKADWEMHAFASYRSNLSVFLNHSHIHNLMSQNNIPYTIIKGCASAYYYPEPIKRAMGDVDFLVDYDNINKVSEVLVSNGFRQGEDNGNYHIEFYKKGFSTELHYELTNLPDNAVKPLLLSYSRECIPTLTSASFSDIGGAKLNIPSDFVHGLSITLHTIRHFVGGSGLGLRHLNDLAVFYNHFSNEEFINIFKERFSKVGLWNFTCVMGYLCHKFLCVPYRSWMESKSDDCCNSIMEDVLASGNFGRKNTTTLNAGIAVLSNKESGEKISKLKRVKGIISWLNSEAVKRYSFCKRFPIFKFFGSIVIMFKFIIKCIKGKRKINDVFNSMNKAEELEEIYSQINLFKDISE